MQGLLSIVMAESDLIYQEKLEKVFSKVQPDQRTSFPYSRFPEIHKFILKNAAEHMGECVKPPFPVVAEIGCGPQPGIIQDIQHEIFKLHAKSSDIADLKKAVDKCTDFVRAKVLSGVDILRLEKLLDKDERNYLWGGFNYHKGSAEHLPLDTKSHDLLVYPFVLSYTNKEDSVEEMKRVLKKDGRVIVLAHAKKHLFFLLMRRLRRLLSRKVIVQEL